MSATRNSDLTFTDLFCGAGGTSIGAKRAGLRGVMAANHWPLAINSHQTNFPDMDHDCADVSQVRVERYPTTDILLASPECTNHSLAKGVSRKSSVQRSLIDGCEFCARHGARNCPTHSDAVLRSRATMWDVPRFAERHRYRIVIVENVVDAAKWEPFEAWLSAMHALGYKHRVVSFNSKFAHPTPQSRDRMYVVFWRRGNRAPNLDITPRAFCVRCAVNVDSIQTWKNGRTIGRYGDATKREQYFYACPRCRAEVKPYYYAGLNALDLSIKATRIGDRKRPLKERTMGRIRFGIEKFGRFPLLITTNVTSDGGRSQPVTAPFFTQTGSNLTALVSPAVMLHMQGVFRTHGLNEPLSTQVASCAQDWIVSATPFLINTRHRHDDACRVRPVSEPQATQTGSLDFAVVLPTAPFLTSTNDFDDRNIPVDSALHTQTTQTKFGVTLPAGFVASLRGTAEDQRPHASASLADSLGTITAGGVHAALLSEAAILNLRDYRNVNQLVSGVGDALPTQVTTPQSAIVQRSPFLVSYYGNDQAAGMDEPIDTITTLDRHALCEPGADINIEDWYFRMLVPHEIGAGMGFPADYVVKGNSREKVKQYGNAVTPAVPDILIRRCIESLHPEVAV